MASSSPPTIGDLQPLDASNTAPAAEQTAAATGTTFVVAAVLAVIAVGVALAAGKPGQ